MLSTFLSVGAEVTSGLLVAAALLHLIPHLGAAGRRGSDVMTRVPMLDLLITYFTVAPLVVGPILGGWTGLLGAVVGQVAALVLWTLAHELLHPAAHEQHRILPTINRKVGVVRNLLATYWTALVVPVFWVIRLAEVFIYPPLTWLVQLPAYQQSQWVNVSRHKFAGLVGHDLVWCLYCDWMTGVWSLATEMLRNVESFWCPIRFASEEKCANCVVDFPDIDDGWVPADGTMADVTRAIDEMYPPAQKPRAWFGHPVRLTVGGRDFKPAASTSSTASAGSAAGSA